MISPAIFNGLGQNSTPIEASLRGVGSPQFPTGYWVSDSDPHFLHSQDMLFWLGSDNLATTFFKGFCCRSGNQRGLKYGAVVFDTSGKKITTHEWTSMPDSPFSVGGIVGAFWLRYDDHIEVLDKDFTVTGQMALPKGVYQTMSKGVTWIGAKEGTKLSIYKPAGTFATASLVLPSETRVADVNGQVVLLNGTSHKSCYIGVWQMGAGALWTLNTSAPDICGRCTSGEGLLSEDAVLIRPYGSLSHEIVHRDGSVETISEVGELLEIAVSGRISFQLFHPNQLAMALDMDFGGQKEITVYDPSKKSIIFRKTIGGQSGAALAPDGNHLAIIEGSSLLIYSLP
jgi:hypothetical protein